MPDTYAIPPGAPSEPLKTRIIEIDEHSTKVAGLSLLATFEDVMRETEKMTHGAIVGMVNWCRTQGAGTTPHWQFKRLFGLIPFPWLLILSLFILIYGAGARWSGEAITVVIGVFVISLLGAAFFTTEYQNDARDTCLICRVGTKEARFGKPIHVVDPRTGKKKQLSRAGYCDDCAWNVYRKNLWTAAEASVWNLIQRHPTRRRNVWRLIGYKLFWWVGYQEECVDPRPVGRGQVYRKQDRWDPKDDIDENVLDNLIRLAFLLVNEAERAKKLKRKI